jgi:DNA-binding CsgD family transcriptional regulator
MKLLLGVAGVKPDDERAYHVLLDSPATLMDWSLRFDEPVEDLPAVAARLVEQGFVLASNDDPPVYEAISLPAAVELALARAEADLVDTERGLEKLRRARAKLAVDARMHADSLRFEVVPTKGQPQTWVRRLGSLAREDFLRLVPRAAVDTYDAETANRVKRRTVYQADLFADGEHMDRVRRRLAVGEDVRLVRDLPYHIVVVDHRRAFVELDDVRGVLVDGSSLLTVVLSLTGFVWERAIPLNAWSRNAVEEWRLSDEDAELLRLLAAGLKDQAIARQLGLGLRTVVRRIGNVARTLDAETRFQAGLQAAKRGFL